MCRPQGERGHSTPRTMAAAVDPGRRGLESRAQRDAELVYRNLKAPPPGDGRWSPGSAHRLRENHSEESWSPSKKGELCLRLGGGVCVWRDRQAGASQGQ